MELLTSQQRLMVWLAVALAVQSVAMLVGYGIEVSQGAAFGGDFAVFWEASVRMHTEGRMLYDPSVLNAVLNQSASPDDRIIPFVYPPPMALLIWPLGYMSYAAAAAVWTITPVILFYWLLWRVLVYSEKEAGKLFPLAAAATLPFITVNIMSGQTGTIVAVLFLTGLRGWQLKRWWSAVAFGAMVIKPQLGLLIPFLYLATRQWKLLGISLATVLVLCALATAVLGLNIWDDYDYMIGVFSAFMHSQFAPYASLATAPYLSLNTTGLPHIIAVWIQVMVSVFVVTAIYQIFKEELHGSPCMRFGLIGCGALMASPHSMAYDTPLVALAACTLLLHAWRKGWANGFELGAFIALLVMPYLQPVMMHFGLAIGWIVLLVFFIALLHRYVMEYQQVK